MVGIIIFLIFWLFQNVNSGITCSFTPPSDTTGGAIGTGEFTWTTTFPEGGSSFYLYLTLGASGYTFNNGGTQCATVSGSITFSSHTTDISNTDLIQACEYTHPFVAGTYVLNMEVVNPSADVTSQTLNMDFSTEGTSTSSFNTVCDPLSYTYTAPIVVSTSSTVPELTTYNDALSCSKDITTNAYFSQFEIAGIPSYYLDAYKIQILGTGNWVYCYMDLLYPFSLFSTISGSSDSTSYGQIYYWPMDINMNTIECEKISNVFISSKATSVNINNSPLQMTTSTNGNGGLHCGYTFWFGWSGSTNQLEINIQTLNSELYGLSLFTLLILSELIAI